MFSPSFDTIVSVSLRIISRFWDGVETPSNSFTETSGMCSILPKFPISRPTPRDAAGGPHRPGPNVQGCGRRDGNDLRQALRREGRPDGRRGATAGRVGVAGVRPRGAEVRRRRPGRTATSPGTPARVGRGGDLRRLFHRPDRGGPDRGGPDPPPDPTAESTPPARFARPSNSSSAPICPPPRRARHGRGRGNVLPGAFADCRPGGASGKRGHIPYTRAAAACGS